MKKTFSFYIWVIFLILWGLILPQSAFCMPVSHIRISAVVLEHITYQSFQNQIIISTNSHYQALIIAKNKTLIGQKISYSKSPASETENVIIVSAF